MLSFPDCKQAYDRAVLSENGVVVKFEDEGARDRFMFRCMTFRMLDRDHNKILYPDPAMTMHGRSIYDQVSVKRDGKNLKLVKIKTDRYEIEDIAEPE